MNAGADQTSQLRRRGLLLAFGLVLGVAFMLACSAGRALAAPGSPGTPQAGTPVYNEGFENTGNTPLAVSGYTGAGTANSGTAADGESYTASTGWDGTNCDGWIFDSASPQVSDPCFSGQAGGAAFWVENQNEAIALGEFAGETSTQAASNHVVAEFTGGINAPGNPGAGTELETSPNQIPAVDGHYYQVTAGYSVINYQPSLGTGCDTLPSQTGYDPQIDFSLLDGATQIPVATNLDPCTASGAQDVTVGGTAIRVAKLTSTPLLWTGGTTMGVYQYNANGGGLYGNDGATDNIQVVDVTPQLDKSFSPAVQTTGQPSTLTFTITNTSELGAKDGWSFTDNLPSGLTIANPASAATTCSSGAVTAAAGSGSVAVTGNLDAGQASCTVSVNVTSATAGSYTNGPGNVTTNGLNPPGPAPITFQDADVQILKSASPATAVPGTNETYTLDVKNNGPAAAANTVVSDPLPAGLTFVSASSGCSFASGKVSCQIGTMTAGATTAFTVVAKVPSSQTARITNTATVSTTTPDSNEANNTSTVVTPVGPVADLGITKVASTGSVVAGGQVTYTLVVNNYGPSDDTGVTVTDPLPAGETLVAAKPSQGSCSATTCNLGNIADGGSAQILVTVTTSTSASGQITNTASVIGNNPDHHQNNNHGGSTITVTQPPAPPAPPQPVSDLQIVKTVNHSKVLVGQTLTYTLKVTNHGPDTATNATITDTPSMALKVLSAKPAHGSCKVSGKVLRCSLGTIANGKSVKITVKAKVNKVGTERNAASTTSSSKDPNPSNNLSKVKAKIVKKPKPRAVLHLRKIASSKMVIAGHGITYHIKVSASKAAAHNVKVCDALPLGLSFTGSAPKAKLSNGKECWTIKTLGAGKSRTITIHAKALKGTSGTKTNHATVTAKGAKRVKAKATVRVKPAPKPPATPVTG
jgi:uncharacterized repeat protein (TIGR01451 family)